MKNKILSIGFLVTLFACTVVYSQNKGDENKSTWKGFERVDFKFEGRDARVIHPKKALPGNSWVWRARFPDYHAEIDSLLLLKGFHVAYVNTDNLFGSPKAVEVWNGFYKYVVLNYKLHEKVALHGHSRGGLFIYNWAKQNAEKVSCIYGDAVVCDFKSWPAGFLSSEGSKKEWEILKEEYEFNTDDEAKTYQNNPINNLERLVQERVPILHTISLNDKIVPPEENTLVLVNNYIRLGGTATVSPCSTGVQKSKGHHYQIDDPDLVVDFIINNSIKKTN